MHDNFQRGIVPKQQEAGEQDKLPQNRRNLNKWCHVHTTGVTPDGTQGTYYTRHQEGNMKN